MDEKEELKPKKKGFTELITAPLIIVSIILAIGKAIIGFFAGLLIKKWWSKKEESQPPNNTTPDA